MKRSSLLLLVCLAILGLSAVPAHSQIGPSTRPGWEADAQTKLAWVFVEPTDPGSTSPISGWEQYVGETLPTWDYDSNREAWGNPAQWYVRIPNVDNSNPKKSFWLCFVYERDTSFTQDRSFTSLVWDPFEKYENFVQSSEWLDSGGNPTTNTLLAVYERITVTVDMFPNPEYEDIFIGVVGDVPPASPDGDNVFELLEVYVLAQCLECVEAADCDDGSVCTVDDCVDNQCQYSEVNCDDSNACTNDSCNSLTGCVNKCNATGPSDACCGNQACLGNPVCNTGTCAGSAQASTFGTTPVYRSSDLSKHLVYLLLPLGAVIGLMAWRMKRK